MTAPTIEATPPASSPPAPPGVMPADIRSAIFGDLATVEAFAAATGLSPRTILRYIAAGRVPMTRVGKTPYIIISKAREALMTPQPRHEQPRRGRPRKHAA